MMPVPSSTNPPSPPGKPRAGPFSLLVRILLSIAIFALVIAIGLRLCDIGGAHRRAINESCRATLVNLTKALEFYREDFGSYPSLTDKPLIADTRCFVKCLQSKGPRNSRSHILREEDLIDGELLSPSIQPFCYTFPADGVPGPDGKVHPNVKYYLWTWGGIGKGPEAAWEINNWDASK